MKREASVERKTKETEISLSLSLDGSGRASINTGIGFLDHMMTAFCFHGGFDMDLCCAGDLNVDSHHTVEDIGIVLGLAFEKALGNKDGISRYGEFTIPMDEALVSCNLDVSGRPYLVFNIDFKSDKLGNLDTQMIKEFFYAFSIKSGVTLHLNQIYGSNDHHIAEACFKAFGHALKSGVARKNISGAFSTKGCL
jgi:imidazoleglycerol-phosphate dehydratase